MAKQFGQLVRDPTPQAKFVGQFVWHIFLAIFFSAPGGPRGSIWPFWSFLDKCFFGHILLARVNYGSTTFEFLFDPPGPEKMSKVIFEKMEKVKF